MKTWEFFTTLLLSTLCLGLSVAIVWTAIANQGLQRDLQRQQQRIANSILGQQSQQLANNVLNDIAAVASTNNAMRRLLSKHGYNVPAEPAAAGESATPTSSVKE